MGRARADRAGGRVWRSSERGRAAGHVAAGLLAPFADRPGQVGVRPVLRRGLVYRAVPARVVDRLALGLYVPASEDGQRVRLAPGYRLRKLGLGLGLGLGLHAP